MGGCPLTAWPSCWERLGPLPQAAGCWVIGLLHVATRACLKGDHCSRQGVAGAWRPAEPCFPPPPPPLPGPGASPRPGVGLHISVAGRALASHTGQHHSEPTALLPCSGALQAQLHVLSLISSSNFSKVTVESV